MAALTEDQKLLVVQALACFDSPQQVADLVKVEFGLSVTRQQVASYDPTKAAGKQVSKKLKAIFEETRAKFLENTASIPIAKQAYRLRVLQRQLERAERQGNTAMVSALLEQAAKETGGAFTNRREVTGKDGGPIQQQAVTAEQVSAEVRRVREDY